MDFDFPMGYFGSSIDIYLKNFCLKPCKESCKMPFGSSRYLNFCNYESTLEIAEKKWKGNENSGLK